MPTPRPYFPSCQPILTAVASSEARTENEGVAPQCRYYLITSQNMPATATKPRVKTSVLMNRIASQ